eukprot:CAMPEP_0176399616 /NCGR_PEP_ID=MMETSP0126-20121128/46903_1 /TAXON_ID=141414 ORGANISM="Strombidinopsis acuminatum, Strain SPMC142" /NCGR_SAMPLE_ID=MMETSP0126 /ASSEMBLY_ACC=CAM_ASM_000229 /LENGTH=79 /DNA_ID=CAMNT_0017775305 /DNA_START=1403 /DNA_END=1642 /DNA_ORIENTATION=+
MNVIFRLAGMDGEATEERVETLNDDSNPSSEKEIEATMTAIQVVKKRLRQNSNLPAFCPSKLLIKHKEKLQECLFSLTP